ncbi:unnamed protein product [Albugo candida]|uniref:Uncharacterized protein n=1 Tax=Albugo candida TaxID=65357 RepID=A0A024GCI6_9STRA|nr:unnamed protein product [Albugo candida]|eukprot:CCI44471.1 unnamed protein product [Albugo candida]
MRRWLDRRSHQRRIVVGIASIRLYAFSSGQDTRLEINNDHSDLVLCLSMRLSKSSFNDVLDTFLVLRLIIALLADNHKQCLLFLAQSAVDDDSKSSRISSRQDTLQLRVLEEIKVENMHPS